MSDFESKPEPLFSQKQVSQYGFELDQLAHQIRNDPQSSQAALRITELAVRFFEFIEPVSQAFVAEGKATTPRHLFEFADVLNRAVTRKQIPVGDLLRVIEQYEAKKDYGKKYQTLRGKVEVLLDALKDQRHGLGEALEKLREATRDQDLNELAIQGIDRVVEASLEED